MRRWLCTISSSLLADSSCARETFSPIGVGCFHFYHKSTTFRKLGHSISIKEVLTWCKGSQLIGVILEVQFLKPTYRNSKANESNSGAGWGNRTPVSTLGRSQHAIKLIPQIVVSSIVQHFIEIYSKMSHTQLFFASSVFSCNYDAV